MALCGNRDSRREFEDRVLFEGGATLRQPNAPSSLPPPVVGLLWGRVGVGGRVERKSHKPPSAAADSGRDSRIESRLSMVRPPSLALPHKGGGDPLSASQTLGSIHSQHAIIEGGATLLRPNAPSPLSPPLLRLLLWAGRRGGYSRA